MAKARSAGHEDSQLPVQLEGGGIAAVNNFTYLGSNITRDGEVKGEVTARLAKVARAFGCLHEAVFSEQVV